MNQPTATEINAAVIAYLPQYADGFRKSEGGKMLLKTPEAMLCREGMIRMLARSFPGITHGQIEKATGFSGPVVRDTLKRIGAKESARAGD